MAYRRHKIKILLDSHPADVKEALRIVRTTYVDCGCQLKATADRLGTSAPSLRRWMEQYPDMKRELAEGRLAWAQSALEEFG